MNIWTNTHEHLDKYTRTFGQIHKNICTNTSKTHILQFGHVPKSRTGIFSETTQNKKTPAAIPTASQMHKNTQTSGQITHSQKQVDKYTKTCGQIHKHIWKHTQTHLDTYTNTC